MQQKYLMSIIFFTITTFDKDDDNYGQTTLIPSAVKL